MMEAFIDGKHYSFDIDHPLGSGGEAYVCEMPDDPSLVVKLWRPPTDPAYAGDLNEQKAAEVRLRTQQKKLLDWPGQVPANVVGPLKLAKNQKGTVIGYAMSKVSGAEVILKYGQPKFRRTTGFGQNDMLTVLRNLCATKSALHARGIVLGDFNDLNVLVRGHEAFIIDVDSAQWGKWTCTTYTTKYVDPTHCTDTPNGPVLAKPHNVETDNYAFAQMVLQSFTYVDAWGGIYTPKGGAPKVTHAARMMHTPRISVFHPMVNLPKSAIPLHTLPDDLLEHLQAVFEKDRRGEFPAALLDRMRWTACSGCGLEHARAQCPSQGCATAAPAVAAQTQVTQVRGTVTATTVYARRGTIVRAEVHGGQVMFLAYDGSALRREDGTVVFRGALDAGLRYRVLPGQPGVSGGVTYLAMGNTVLRFEGGSLASSAGSPLLVDTVDGAPVFQVTSAHVYWCEGGALWHDAGVGGLAPVRIGNVLSDRTRFWVGDKMGFGYYPVGGGTRAFVFGPEARGINDSVPINIKGKLLDATSVMDGERAWFFTTTQEGPNRVNRCYLVKFDGTLAASECATAGDGSWLGAIRGAAAIGGALLVPTDAGVVRVAPQNGQLVVTRQFPDTEPWVAADSRLLTAADGLYVLSGDGRTLTRLTIK